MTDRAALVDTLIAARERAALLPLPSSQGEVSLNDAYAVGELIRQRRIAAGERPCGYKIGFTNRSIWPKYGVYAPIWAPVWDSTVRLLDGPTAQLSLAGLVQPRLEPEIVFGFAHAPRAGGSDAELMACLAWVAHGVEVVHTHFADWRFTAPDCVADFGLHGALLIGPRHTLDRTADLSDELAALELVLARDEEVVERGRGSVVLGSPIQALQLWLQAMAAQTPQWTVQPGDVVTTGTLTDAWPLAAGEFWQTTLSDPRLAGLSLTVTD